MAKKDDINTSQWNLFHDDPSGKYEDLSKKESSTIIANTRNVSGHGSDQVWQDLRAAQDTKTRLTTDMDIVMRKLADLEKKGNTMYRAMMSMQSENTQLRQDLTDMQVQFQQYQRDASVTALQRKVISLTQELQKDVTTVKQEVTSLQIDVTQTQELQNNVTKLQQEVTSLKTDVTQTWGLQNIDVTLLKQEVISLKTETTSLQNDVTKLEQDMNTVKTGVKQTQGLQTKTTSLQNDVTKLEQDMQTVTTDVKQTQGLQTKTTSLQNDVTKLEQDMKIVTTKVTQRLPKITSSRLDQLETKTRKLSTAVAFAAYLKKDITTTKEGMLTCDKVITNIGGGYNGHTGVFTAPIAGIHCFMLSVSSGSVDSSVTARAAIMHGAQVIGYVLSKGHQWATGHVTVHLPAGGKVWLETYGDKQYIFSDWTHFTGLLVSPDV